MIVSLAAFIFARASCPSLPSFWEEQEARQTVGCKGDYKNERTKKVNESKPLGDF